jgi:uncharacterized membrane protein YccC
MRLSFYYTNLVYIITTMPKPARALRNITVTLDEQIAAWLRLHAAKRGMSVSRLVGDFVHERMSETQDYNEAMRQFLSEKPFRFEWLDHRPGMREHMHCREKPRGEFRASANDSEESK